MADTEGWVLTCYGVYAGEFDNLDRAITAADEHIHTCPTGPVPQETQVS